MPVTLKIDYDFSQVQKIKKNVNRLKDSHIEWGWVDRHKKYSVSDRTRSGIFVATVAIWQEFGTVRKGYGGVVIMQEPRPYMQQSFSIMKATCMLEIRAIAEAAFNGDDMTLVIEAFGKKAVSSIRQSIHMQNMPPLKESTVRKKKGNYQWVETGKMLETLNFRFVRSRVKKKNDG